MSVSALTYTDPIAGNVSVAARNTLGAYYPMSEPETLTFHRVATGTSGDAVNVASAAAVLRAVRIFNNGSAPCFVKFHNTSGTPTAGASVAYAIGCQAGQSNPDPRIAAGGRAFSSGIGMTIVTGLTDASSTGVTASTVLVEVEYHLA